MSDRGIDPFGPATLQYARAESPRRTRPLLLADEEPVVAELPVAASISGGAGVGFCRSALRRRSLSPAFYLGFLFAAAAVSAGVAVGATERRVEVKPIIALREAA